MLFIVIMLSSVLILSVNENRVNYFFTFSLHLVFWKSRLPNYISFSLWNIFWRKMKRKKIFIGHSMVSNLNSITRFCKLVCVMKRGASCGSLWVSGGKTWTELHDLLYLGYLKLGDQSRQVPGRKKIILLTHLKTDQINVCPWPLSPTVVPSNQRSVIIYDHSSRFVHLTKKTTWEILKPF